MFVIPIHEQVCTSKNKEEKFRLSEQVKTVDSAMTWVIYISRFLKKQLKKSSSWNSIIFALSRTGNFTELVITANQIFIWKFA